MTDIDKFLQEVDYHKSKLDVKKRDSIADLIPNNKRCGIYVLHFANDEYYIGLSVNVRTRFTQHRKTYSDISYLSFKTVPIERLRKEEEQLIKSAENAGFQLRNKVHTSVTVSSSPFDEIMDHHTQTRWLNDPTFNDFSGERVVDEDLKRKYSRNFQKLRELPQHKDAIDLFCQFVSRCIPAPIQTELYYWSVSCLPGNSKQLYIRLNIKQEVLRIIFDGANLVYTFFLTKSQYEADNVLKNLWQSGKHFIKYHAIATGVSMYEAGGQDQIAITIYGYENAAKALQNEHFIRAIRTLNLNIMRKTFNLQYRYHCYDLAGTVLDRHYE